HLEGSNFLMADGHVKWYRGSAVSSGIQATSSTAAQDNSTANNAAAAGTEATTGNYAVTFSPI
ncbi:MAG TPA: H-X9-DG-CTERM domain-containing protein, partial [Abditibacteriaceae bacterium]